MPEEALIRKILQTASVSRRRENIAPKDVFVLREWAKERGSTVVQVRARRANIALALWQGKSIEQVARTYRTSPSVVSRVWTRLVRGGVNALADQRSTRSGKHRSVTVKAGRKIRRLRAEGHTLHAIAAMINISYGQVWRELHEPRRPDSG
jgi:transposase